MWVFACCKLRCWCFFFFSSRRRHTRLTCDWSSDVCSSDLGSKWSLFGGMREAAQMVSYEVPMALCVVVPVIVAGTMNLTDIANQQRWLWDWLVFRDPFTFIAFCTYFTCATASCKPAPFDLAEA